MVFVFTVQRLERCAAKDLKIRITWLQFFLKIERKGIQINGPKGGGYDKMGRLRDPNIDTYGSYTPAFLDKSWLKLFDFRFECFIFLFGHIKLHAIFFDLIRHRQVGFLPSYSTAQVLNFRKQSLRSASLLLCYHQCTFWKSIQEYMVQLL